MPEYDDDDRVTIWMTMATAEVKGSLSVGAEGHRINLSAIEKTDVAELCDRIWRREMREHQFTTCSCFD